MKTKFLFLAVICLPAILAPMPPESPEVMMCLHTRPECAERISGESRSVSCEGGGVAQAPAGSVFMDVYVEAHIRSGKRADNCLLRPVPLEHDGVDNRNTERLAFMDVYVEAGEAPAVI